MACIMPAIIHCFIQKLPGVVNNAVNRSIVETSREFSHPIKSDGFRDFWSGGSCCSLRQAF